MWIEMHLTFYALLSILFFTRNRLCNILQCEDSLQHNVERDLWAEAHVWHLQYDRSLFGFLMHELTSLE